MKCKCNRTLVEGRCPGCNRSAFCKCPPIEARRESLWLETQRARRNGLARDLSGVA